MCREGICPCRAILPGAGEPSSNRGERPWLAGPWVRRAPRGVCPDRAVASCGRRRAASQAQHPPAFFLAEDELQPPGLPSAPPPVVVVATTQTCRAHLPLAALGHHRCSLKCVSARAPMARVVKWVGWSGIHTCSVSCWWVAQSVTSSDPAGSGRALVWRHACVPTPTRPVRLSAQPCPDAAPWCTPWLAVSAVFTMAERAEAFYSGVKPITKDDIKTIQYDGRFPSCNQTKHCWQNFVDFHKCVKMKVRSCCGGTPVPRRAPCACWRCHARAGHCARAPGHGMGVFSRRARARARALFLSFSLSHTQPGTQECVKRAAPSLLPWPWP